VTGKRQAVRTVLLLLATACVSDAPQSMLDPAGAQSASIYRLWIYMLVVAVLVYVAVMAALVIAVRGRRSEPESDRDGETSARRVVSTAVAVTAGILFFTLVLDFATGRHLMHGQPENALTIKLTGYRWWWDVEYTDSQPQRHVRLANEIHLPVNQVVRIELISHDVIHSFWVPSLGGKKDLIPGHDNEMWLRAEQPGVYRAQCAEFCGLQHANMALFVVVEPEDQFNAWLAKQRQPAPDPIDSLAVRGRAIIENGSCAVCHTVTGTRAAGRVGPDLTHVASRLSLAAGTLPNTRGALSGWIADPQTVKPGAQMPPQSLHASDLRAVVAYLETLR
jgi:cytochrome c oxidase subunit II